MTEPPKPRFTLEASFGASELETLIHEISQLATRLLMDFREGGNKSISARSSWGGGGAHGHYDLIDRGGPSLEEYKEQLMAWHDEGR